MHDACQVCIIKYFLFSLALYVIFFVCFLTQVYFCPLFLPPAAGPQRCNLLRMEFRHSKRVGIGQPQQTKSLEQAFNTLSGNNTSGEFVTRREVVRAGGGGGKMSPPKSSGVRVRPKLSPPKLSGVRARPKLSCENFPEGMPNETQGK